MRPAGEQDLVQRARDGSLHAFDQLMRTYQHRLYRFLRVHGASEADAEDLVQETFLAAWRGLHGYRPKWRFSTWLYTIARRLAARQSRQRPPPAAAAQPAANAPPPDLCFLARQQRDNLWALAAQLLSRAQVDTLWLYYAEDMNVREIARVLDRSVAWVKVSLYRARTRLAGSMVAEDWVVTEGVTHE